MLSSSTDPGQVIIKSKQSTHIENWGTPKKPHWCVNKTHATGIVVKMRHIPEIDIATLK